MSIFAVFKGPQYPFCPIAPGAQIQLQDHHQILFIHLAHNFSIAAMSAVETVDDPHALPADWARYNFFVLDLMSRTNRFSCAFVIFAIMPPPELELIPMRDNWQ
jgi:hypothetical protein